MNNPFQVQLTNESGGRLVALISARNGEAAIGAALELLAGQARPPDEVIVIADRCTDRTAEIAVAHGARVFHTVGGEFDKPLAQKGRLQVALMDLQPSYAVRPVDTYGD